MRGKEERIETIRYSVQASDSLFPGVQAERDGVRFSCDSQGEQPYLLLYRPGERVPACEIPFPETSGFGGVRSMKVRLPGNTAWEYNYRVGDTVFTDPYAPRICGREVFGSRAEGETGVCRVQTDSGREDIYDGGIEADAGRRFSDPHRLRGAVPRKSYDWKGDRLPRLAFEDAVMYQLHVRGFTMQKNSGVRHKGTFRGIEEKLPYLKELGVNQLRLMPCYEFDEVAAQPLAVGEFAVPAGAGRTKPQAEAWTVPKETDTTCLSGMTSAYALHDREAFSRPYRLNYWGYAPGYYFAPKAAYASRPERAPEELKDLIRACHRLQMELILEFWFGEETDVSMIAQCLTYWAREYHVDGFAVIARDSVTAELGRLPLFSDHKLICGWYTQDTLKRRRNQEQRLLAEDNDGFKNDCRRLLKGDEDCLKAFAARLRKNPPEHAVLNYVTNHDGFTLTDLVSYDRKHNEANGEQGRDGSDFNYSWNCGTEGPTTIRQIRELRMRQRKNAFAVTLLAQGTPMLLAGDEFGNSQAGNNNPYCHDSELTWLDWGGRRSFQELTRFVRKLIAFRQKHKVLHMDREPYGSDLRCCGYPELSFHSSRAWYGAFEPANRYLGCMYDESYADGPGFLYIAYNFHWESQKFALPLLPKQLRWRRIMDTSKKESFIPEEEQLIYEQEKSFQVSPRTVVILETDKREDCVSEEGGAAADLGEDKRPF